MEQFPLAEQEDIARTCQRLNLGEEEERLGFELLGSYTAWRKVHPSSLAQELPSRCLVRCALYLAACQTALAGVESAQEN